MSSSQKTSYSVSIYTLTMCLFWRCKFLSPHLVKGEFFKSCWEMVRAALMRHNPLFSSLFRALSKTVKEQRRADPAFLEGDG